MGKGIIKVSSALFEDVDAPKQPQTLAEWQALLMLPEGYQVLEAKMDTTYPYWNVVVEHKDIPVAEGKLPEVIPTFARENYEDGTNATCLERVDVRVATGESEHVTEKIGDISYAALLPKTKLVTIWQRNSQ